jgi:hypothetical protein
VAQVQAAVAGQAMPIRALAQEEALGLVTARLTLAAQAYGARKEVHPAVMAEAVHLVAEKFKMLGPDEIVEAYRMKAAGELEMPPGKGEMWGGEFNAQQLGEVLTAYLAHRRRVLSAYNRAEAERRGIEEQALRRERMRAEYEANFERNLAENEIQDWREAPVHWFDTARRRGLLKMSRAQAEAILEDARELARIEAAEGVSEAKTIWEQAAASKAAQDGEALEERAKTIARKLSVFRFLILPARAQNQ